MQLHILKTMQDYISSKRSDTTPQTSCNDEFSNLELEGNEDSFANLLRYLCIFT